MDINFYIKDTLIALDIYLILFYISIILSITFTIAAKNVKVNGEIWGISALLVFLVSVLSLLAKFIF